MARSLTEDITRGRRAIALVRERGMDTVAWEECLAELERQGLLAWASELAEQDLVLAEPVCFIEAPLHRVTTERVSWYAAHYLRTITTARVGQETGGWGMYDAKWHRKCEEEALGALAALKDAMDNQKAEEE